VDVFLVPVQPAGRSTGPEFALYCEPGPDPVEPELVGPEDGGAGPARPGMFTRLWMWMKRSFIQALAEGEAERRRQEAGQPELAGGSRMGRFVKKKLADSVVEHRLHWALRNETSARLVHPESVPADRALAWTMAQLRRDLSKHRLWAVVDGVLVIASGIIAPIPGPNLIAYFLIFRCGSHYLSWVGARRGLRAEMWTTLPSAALSDVAVAMALPVVERDARIDEAARALGLERLTAFVRKTAPSQTGRP
jgi:hypothetical protein